MRISIANLRAAGMSAEQIVKVLEEADADRREKERIKKRNQRARPQDGGDRGDSPSLSLTSSNLPSSEDRKQEARLEIVALGREFAEFYARYPHKVGRPYAEKCFAKARKRAPMSEIMAGLDRYLAKTDDRHWCNPSTFLNQERWADKPGQPKGARPSSDGPVVNVELLEEHRRNALMGRGGQDGEQTQVRGNTGLGEKGSGEPTQLRPTVGVVRREN